MSSILTNIMEAMVDDHVTTLHGRTLTRPLLTVGDGTGNTYAVDVDIGEGEILYSVPIAAGNNELKYAEAGSPVMLERTDTGRWMVMGFSKVMPGTYMRVPVDLPNWQFNIPTYSIGTPTNEGLEVRPLTYGELQTYGGYGVVPYGAVGHFKDGQLIGIV